MKTATATPHPMETQLGRVTCVCELCLGVAPARILTSVAEVSYQKVCPIHGIHRSVVSTDPEYFIRCRSQQGGDARNTIPAKRLDPSPLFKPPRSAMVILEIVQGCNARCPTCSAASLPEVTGILPLAEVNTILDRFVTTAPQHDLLMISGGEPTLHPQIIDVLKAAHEHRIARVMLVTNGIRIARDPQFVSKLAELGSWLEIYLQFDSLSEGVLRVLRGEDLREVRALALASLERHQIATTLVSVVKKGLNDHEIGGIIDTGLTYKCVRGVTFQPLRAVGRTEGFDPASEWITLAEVRRNVLASGHFPSDDLQPHPCNPEMICIGYLSRRSGLSITSTVLNLTANSAGTPPSLPTSVRESMFFSPQFEQVNFAYEDLFRVCIVSYADRFDFTFEGAIRSCIHFLTRDGALVPLEHHYLFPSDVSNYSVQRLDEGSHLAQNKRFTTIEMSTLAQNT